MLFSNLFCPILKENPKDAVVKSHILMLKAGLIRQTASGIYAFLPLGLKVLNNITNIIVKEINQSGGNYLLMPTIQNADLWYKSGRYTSYGQEMLKITDRHNKEMLFSPTNEEQITALFNQTIQSYKELPLYLYQINWKFRDEIRPRFGLMRGREFLMKDGYSFDLTPQEATLTYKKTMAAYLKIFNSLGLKALPMKADTGPIGGDLSHEFLIVAETGESTVYCDKNILELSLQQTNINYSNTAEIEEIFNKYTSYYSVTQEEHNPQNPTYLQNKDNIVTTKAIEIGHIFYFADKYTKALDVFVLDKNQQPVYPLMGSYGIGVSRLLAAIVEACSDNNGIVWPAEVAPFYCVINSLGNNAEVVEKCNQIYTFLQQNNIEVIYNNKEDSAGNKLYTADLLGFPFQINLGNKGIKNGFIEVKNRKTNTVTNVDINNTKQLLQALNV